MKIILLKGISFVLEHIFELIVGMIASCMLALIVWAIHIDGINNSEMKELCKISGYEHIVRSGDIYYCHSTGQPLRRIIYINDLNKHVLE